jgi:gamma-glutamyltranspeptidase/glutathione hydrolase
MSDMPGWDFPYQSYRFPAFGDAGVATTQPLAAQAGLAMLRNGGNAVDAAVATAIALTVVEPTANGLGSDAFAQVWDGTRLHGLNGSGRSPAGWTRARFAQYNSMPERGWDTVTVPGAVSAWAALSRRFGKLPFADLFEPAIRYARDGFLVPVFIATNWKSQATHLQAEPTFRATFMPNGRSPAPGERFVHRDVGKTLELIADSSGEQFYRGEVGAAVAAFSAERGAALTADDLAGHEPEWVDPVSIPFGAATVHELPPNTQGVAVLVALGILDRLDLPPDPDDPQTTHLAAEAVRLALADVYRDCADPESMRATVDALLSGARLDELAAGIDPRHTSGLVPRGGRSGGTVYLASADSDGMMVSYIQSNFMGFGSGLVVPGTGIALQNRGACFVLEPGHPNEVGPGKRPMHTIIPGFLTEGGRPLAAFGVTGGAMQAQAQTQIVLRMLRYRQNPQAAADAPRWKVDDDGVLGIDHSAPPELVAELVNLGHRIRRIPAFSLDLGSAQVIERLPAGGYVGATESRRDGIAALI